VRLIVVAALCGSALGFVAHRSVADEPAPNYGGEKSLGLWAEHEPYGYPDDVCIASGVQRELALTMRMSCRGGGFLSLVGTIDPVDGSFSLSGPIGRGTFSMTAPSPEESGTWAAEAGDVRIAGTFRNVPGVLRGYVSCPQEPPGPFSQRPLGSIDALLIQQYAAGLLSDLPCRYLGDVNVDGSIDSVDSLLLLQFIAHLIEHFPPY
jgi:hypothetical protein